MESGLDVLIPRLCRLGAGVEVCCCGTVGVMVVTTTANVVIVDRTPFVVMTDSNDIVELDVNGVGGVVGVKTSGVVGGGVGVSILVVDVVEGRTGLVDVVDVEVVDVVVSDDVEEVDVVEEEDEVVEVVDEEEVVDDVEVVVLFDCRLARA